MRIGIMGAMHEEIALLKDEMLYPEMHNFGGRTYCKGKLFDIDTVLVYSRCGKVASAATVATLLSRFEIDLLIFTGVAGAVDEQLNIGDVIIGDQLVQHDVNASPIFAKYEIPLLGKTSFSSDGNLATKLKKAADLFLEADLKRIESLSKAEQFNICKPKSAIGTIASGDQFMDDPSATTAIKVDFPDLLCVEMEGAAVAQVCYEHEMPFIIIRTISDKADKSADIDFERFINTIAAQYSRGIIKHFYNLL